MIEKLQRTVYILLIISFSIGLLYLLSDFLAPIVLAGILAMLFIRLSNNLEARGVGRGLSALISVLLFITCVAIIISLLTWQLSDFSANVEGIKERLLSIIDRLRLWLNETLGISEKQQEEIIKQQGSPDQRSNMLTTFALGTFSVIVNTILVLVYMFLLLYYRSRIKAFIIKLVPDMEKRNTERIISESTKVSQHYLGGLAAMILLLWILYGIGFSLIGVENAIFFAVLCGILEIVPFVGNITGTFLTVLGVLAQGGNEDKVIGVLVVYGLVQFFQTYILEPLIVGDQVNINPLFTIMVLVAGESLWGIPGMVIAIPLLGIIKIICDNIPQLTPYGFLIGVEKKHKRGILDRLKKAVTRS